MINSDDYLLCHTNSHRHVNMIINELTIKTVNKLMGNIIAMYWFKSQTMRYGDAAYINI